jgi:hypothetical protein
MANIVHKMIISITDNGQITVSGIPDRLDAALSLIAEANKAIVNYFITEMQKGNTELTEQNRIIRLGNIGAGPLRNIN